MNDQPPNHEEQLTWESQIFHRIREKFGAATRLLIGQITLAAFFGCGSLVLFGAARTSGAGLPPLEQGEVAQFTPFFFWLGVVLALSCAGTLIHLLLRLWQIRKKSSRNP